MSQLTLKQGVERLVKAELPEVKEVVAAYEYESAGC
jgi:Fe-S cluster biogenesis protein NfuA